MQANRATHSWYLALDQGGHASRAIVMDAAGHTIADEYVEIHTRRGDNFHVEHDAAELAGSLQECCRRIAAALGDNLGNIKSAGLATQRSSIVCWRKDTGAAITPVLSWQDRRAWQFMEARIAHAPQVEAVTGLVMSPHYGASKINWCLHHDAEVQRQLAAHNLVAGPLASYLVRQLVGGHNNTCDPANASRTLLWDRRTCNWSDELCDLFEVDNTLLPESVPSAYPFGALHLETRPAGDAGATTSGHSVPLVMVTGDQSAAIYAFGQPATDTAYVNLGTGAFLQWPVGCQAVDVKGLLNSVVFQDAAGPEYVLEGTVNGAGSALAWHATQHAADTKELVSKGLDKLRNTSMEPPVFLNGIAGLGSPYWLSDFKSGFLSAASPELGAVGILESIAFLLHANIEKITASGRDLQRIVLTGGLSRVDYLCQVIADLNSTQVIRADIREATAKGVGYLLCRDDSWPRLEQGQQFLKNGSTPLMKRHARWRQAMREAGARS